MVPHKSRLQRSASVSVETLRPLVSTPVRAPSSRPAPKGSQRPRLPTDAEKDNSESKGNFARVTKHESAIGTPRPVERTAAPTSVTQVVYDDGELSEVMALGSWVMAKVHGFYVG